MRKFKQMIKELWTDESGAAATEYIFLLVIIVAIAAIFKEKIKEAVSSKVNDVAGQIQGFSGD
jgi:Flp pilus assembly pilin Flp